MNFSVWTLFPYPTVQANGTRIDGAIRAWPPQCQNCVQRYCEKDLAVTGEIKTCPFGINYVRASPEVLVAGVVVSDVAVTSKRALKVRRKSRSVHIKKIDILNSLETIWQLDDAAHNELATAQRRKTAELIRSGDALDGVLVKIKEDLTESLNRSHDFIQLVREIRGNVVTILEKSYPGEPPEIAADKMELEGAIFFATELMQGKIDSTIYLNEPNRAFGSERTLELHRFITKYYRIYRSQTRHKEVDLRTTGSSFGKVHYNSEALGVVVQSLLDNLVKYAPPGSKADIHFAENSDHVTVTFSSLGPRIPDSELDSIFLPGYRTSAARDMDSTGIGFGLAAAKKISELLDIELKVSQSPVEEASFPSHFATNFSIRLERS